MNDQTNVHKNWTLFAACLGTFMLLIDVTIVIVALPSIRDSLHTSFSDVQWTIDAYSLTLASLLLAMGSLGDIIGRRRLFAGGLAIFTLGSLLCALSTSGLMLVLCRAFQGIGGATLYPTSLALLAQTFHGKERGFAFGIWGAVAGAASGIGPLLGGLLTSELSWRWIFYVNLPIGALAILITLTRVQEFRPAKARSIDIPGVVVFTAGLFALVYGLIESSRDGWGSTHVVVALALSVVLLAAFPLLERTRREPMFDLRLFRKPTFVGGSLAAFGMNGSLFAMLLYITLYLQNSQGYSPLGAGLRQAIITFAMMLTAIPAGRASQRVSARWLIGPGLVFVGVGLLLMRGITADSSWTHLLPGFLVAGFGAGLVNPPLASTAIGVVPPRDAGMASGINSTFRQVAIATAIAALGSIFAHGLAGATSVTIHADYASTLNELLLIAACVAFVTGLAALALIRRRDFVQQGVPPVGASQPQPSAEPQPVPH
ncbi:MAG TPA: MFS transporter [Solirubrobacteraceae bacterium]|jgi:EmrB/QacA subfamily drug resistance transporter|nr:MFS transporter [Solirubrobacteraceae bacterium]